MLQFARNHKIVTTLAALLIFGLVAVGCRIKGPYRLYRVDCMKPDISSLEEPGALGVGVAQRDITPDMNAYDTWTDADDDGRFKPENGDTFTDTNGNGRMDLVWLAGFSSNRPAKGVHDPLWVRAIAFRNNGVTVAMVTIDSIGITLERFIKVRKSLDSSLGIDHVMFSTTHNHEAPDTMGIWSYSILRSKFDDAYMDLVLAACKDAVEEAVRSIRPADMSCVAVDLDPDGFVKDTRKPVVHDKTLCCARFTKPGTDDTIATVVGWGSHPETLGSKNSLITSDFAHYWREGVEKGVPEPNGVEGLGGMCLYFQGMVGGLMTPLHLDVPHRDGSTVLTGDTYEKAEALGENLAIETVRALRSDAVAAQDDPKVAAAAKTFFAPISGTFTIPIFLGLIHPGWYWGKAKTEVNVIRIGGLEILTCPGELYPEIAEGGIEAPDGADFGCDPVEVPPLRAQMKGTVNMVVGMANDEIGYIIPKSQWDTEKPYAYDDNPEKPRTKAQYGEDNSGGPDVAGVYHKEALALLERMHAAF
ncbi:MAG: hypothetical protein GY851_29855 [bacterium]|nr:hypothetical protein [bacterium]